MQRCEKGQRLARGWPLLRERGIPACVPFAGLPDSLARLPALPASGRAAVSLGCEIRCGEARVRFRTHAPANTLMREGRDN